MDIKIGVRPNETGLDFESVAPDALAKLSGHALPPALNTGIGGIDFGHAQLLASMASLRKMCVDVTRDSCHLCDGAQRENCESSLIGLLGDLLMFVLDHFHQEEKAMRESMLYMMDREVCEAHMEDHAHISEKIQQIVAVTDPSKTVIQVRDLDRLLETWLSNHVVLHDRALDNWMARQDSIIARYPKALIGSY